MGKYQVGDVLLNEHTNEKTFDLYVVLEKTEDLYTLKMIDSTLYEEEIILSSQPFKSEFKVFDNFDSVSLAFDRPSKPNDDHSTDAIPYLIDVYQNLLDNYEYLSHAIDFNNPQKLQELCKDPTGIKIDWDKTHIKIPGGDVPYKTPTIKPKVCECGKEKHGFAKHSDWCDLYE